MKKLNSLLSATVVLALLLLGVNPLQGADMKGKVGLGLHGGLYKLGLSDHQDAWTPGWLANGDLKYGISSKWAIGVEGSLMKTYLADLSEGTKMEDGAGLSFTKIEDGPQQRAYVAGLFAEYRFLANSSWSPYVTFGTGLYIWKWTDKDGNTLMSDDPSLDPAYPGSGLSIPTEDKAGNPYELKDQELYVSGGLGFDVFLAEWLSLELGGNFRYLTHVFTDFTGDKDIVGTDPGQLDLPKAVGEVYAGLTFFFGGNKCPPSTATATANPTSGSVPMTVQFDGSATGGCPEYTYAWSFGDGGTSSDHKPSHTYEAVGNYIASLSVTDSKGNTSQTSVTVAVTCPPLTGAGSATPTSGKVPLTVKLDGTATGGCPGATTTYSWDFGDGATSTEQSPSHTYAKPGNYTASLTVTDSKGGTSKKTVSITASAEDFVPTPEKPVILEGVNFEHDKAVLLEVSKQILDRVATSLLAHPDVKVEVGGHCDSDGSDVYNLRLSDRRAKAVRDYLISKGVPASQLMAKGYGEAKPIADNNTAEGKAKNRRVELKRM